MQLLKMKDVRNVDNNVFLSTNGLNFLKKSIEIQMLKKSFRVQRASLENKMWTARVSEAGKLKTTKVMLFFKNRGFLTKIGIITLFVEKKWHYYLIVFRKKCEKTWKLKEGLCGTLYTVCDVTVFKNFEYYMPSWKQFRCLKRGFKKESLARARHCKVC